MANKNQSAPDDEFKLSGNVKVIAKEGNTYLSGAIITATNSKLGITRTAASDENGRYEITRMRKGTWKISVSAAGYQSQDVLNLKLSDNDRQDFLLKPGFSISGSIYRITDQHRIGGAVIVAENSSGVRKTTVSDDDGDYKFHALAEGKWALYVFHETHQPSQKTEIDLVSDNKGKDFKLHDIMGTADIEGGTRFLNKSIAGLLLLVFIYVFSHYHFPPSPKAELFDLQRTVTESLVLLNEGDLEKSDKGKSIINSVSDKIKSQLNKNEDVNSTVSGFLSETEVNTLNQLRSTLTDVSNALAEVETNQTADTIKSHKEKAVNLLTSLNKEVKRKLSQLGYFWSEIPLYFLEILFWAMAGVMVNIIVSTGYYLRKGRFYREGIMMHRSHIAAVPFLVLVVMLLLSVFSLEFVFQGDTSLKLDLSNPVMLVSIAFLLATRPWLLLDFVKEKAGKILGSEDKNEGGK